MVVLGGSAIVAAPSEAAAAVIGEAFSGLTVEAVANAEAVGSVLPVAEALGPATLGYLAEGDFRQMPTGSHVVDQLAAGNSELHELEQSAGEADADEAGLGEITSPAFAIRIGGVVAAASGYRIWPRRIAHISVLTAPGRRGQGLARAVASSAVAHALTAGLLPQWRARPAASRRVATALGFRELGAQLSFKLL
ncbi:GNAT family N-acetyltransferase [Actinospica sp.]|uniref:GNAT family N-acetyltransferase n=1 Tax=Actinospica sp. TaxID=1872142 RepID=UPI002C910C18|nr:GNAT family N-acetyltransferase [Actinospica sp.]HWG28434.1 GNAT family N-acetyltransferase [Actinospica sp.]